MTNIITIDLESYYDTYCSVSKGKLTYIEYVRHPEFEFFGASIKINDAPAKWYRPTKLIQALDKLEPDCILVGHNLAFDGVIFDELGILIKASQYFCTLSAARALFGASIDSNSLSFLAQKFLQSDKIQGVLTNRKGKHWNQLTLEEQENEARYCEQDANLTYKLFQLFFPALSEEEKTTLHLTLKMYLEPLLEVNQQLLQQTIIDSEQARTIQLLKAGEILNTDPIKTLKLLGSNQQFAKALEQYVPVPLKPSPTNSDKQIPALAKADLEMQALCNSFIPEVNILCNARLNAKSNITRTRAERFLKDDVPKSRTFLNYCGAISTFRDSGGQRSNKQNLTRGSTLRQSIQAPDGYKLMVIDSSNIELRTMFLIAGQENVLKRIRAGEDEYTHAASEEIYHKPLDEITKEERFVGKVQRLSLQYGSGWKKMQYIFAAGLMGPAVELTDREAQKIWSTYRIKNRQVALFWKKADRMITNMVHGIQETFYIPGTEYPLYTTQHEQIYSHSSGLTLYFHELRSEPDKGWTYKNRKGRSKIYGGMLTGRLNQSFARNIVFWQINRIAEHYPLVLRIHDEGVFVIKDGLEEIKAAEALALKWFATPPPFAPGLPCEGELVTAKTYEKPG